MSLLLSLLLLIQQTELPFKPSDEFKLEVEYKFKTKPLGEHVTIDYTETREQAERRTGGPLPYLIIHLTPLKLLQGEERIRVTDETGKVIQSFKTKAGTPFKIDLGFTDDMKDGVTSNEYRVTFMLKNREEVNQVFMVIHEDGSFIVNGELRGKF